MASPTTHMNLFLRKGQVLLDKGHEYAVCKQSDLSLPVNDAANGMRLIQRELDTYCAVTDKGSVVTLLPPSSYDLLGTILPWLSYVSAMLSSDKFDYSSVHLIVREHCAVILGALEACFEAADGMWSLGIMSSTWFPWQLALIATYWNVTGFLQPSMWADIVGDSRETWLLISMTPGK
ncbi:hypothetical protein QCA50_012560 [Cerrena zonata]|uniref:Uncharacterized protein n=1 Tax=Cerrena zonata TaxID=2478898 RepID=A0AAW0FTS4_9APHY